MAEVARKSLARETSYSFVAIAVTLIFVFPIYWAASISLRQPIESLKAPGIGIPFLSFEPTIEHWVVQLANRETQQALVNSTIVSLSATALALLVGLPAAYALARFRYQRFKNADITVWFLSQRVLPPVATVIPFFLLARTVGLLDTHLALVLINATFVLPFVVVIMRQTFLDLPYELEEAAMVDGATYFQAFWKIALPLGAPSLMATGLIIYAFTWNDFLFALTLSAKDTITIPVHIASTVGTRGTEFWFLAVRALTAMIPPLIIALLAQRYIVRGLTLGGVKG